MKLKKILQLHDQFKTKGHLCDNLGDGYLLTHNPVFKNLRLQVNKSGFQFTADRFQDYDSLSLTQLPFILQKKQIPFVDNVNALREIEKKIPGRFSLTDIPPLKSNHVFHESAHAVAHGLIQKYFPLPKQNGIAKDRLLAFTVLLEESFANACESFANIDALNEEHDEFLFKNAYIMESLATRKVLRAAADQFGRTVVFKLLMLSFLHANLLQTERGMENIVPALQLSFSEKPRELKTLRTSDIRLLQKVFKTGFDLDPKFTRFTNRFCLELLGIKKPIESLFKVDFVNIFGTHPSARQCLNSLCAIALST
jgi:hypothetical protein